MALAEKTAVLFTKDGDQHNNLHDMQCMWSVFVYCIGYIVFVNYNLGTPTECYSSFEGMNLLLVKVTFDKVILDGP